MKRSIKLSYLKSLILLPLTLLIFSCEKIDDAQSKIPLVSFETSQISVNTEAGSYEAIVKLSQPAAKSIKIKVGLSGNAVENEHYTVVSKEINIAAGEEEGKLPITILHDNIWDENLEIVVILSPGTDYVIDPNQVSEIKIKLTKEIVLPVLSFDMTELSKHTNPFNSETISFNIKLDQPLRNDAQLNLGFEGDLTIGGDFNVNGGNNNKVTLSKEQTSFTFTIKVNKKDQAGFDKSLNITLSPVDPKTFTVSQDKSAFTLKISDPLVNLSPMLKTAALLGGSGFQVYQNIKTTTGWSSNVTVNADANTIKKNYLKTFKNMSFNTAFGCESNGPGGDVLRLAELLNFATTDTVIADYGVGKTTRYFNPTDSLLRFVAEGENPMKGSVTTVPQKFSAKLVLKVDWETGSNGFKQWHVDSKATGGNINASTYPVIGTITIDLDKIEGTYDFTLDTPEVVFTAWFKSNSPHFMKNLNSTYDIVKDGEYYKVTYRYFPR